MPIYLFEPGKPMSVVPYLPGHSDATAKSYALLVYPNQSRRIFYVFSPRIENWLVIKDEGVPPEYRAMALLIPTS